ncbi:LysM peptidoglycan-binding domain-containing protein [Nitrogeniibacter mangrovi]|uniref:LysM peptidoglycan-binding domain-containing protein n=1 Tax=Nitrogeniibacter mangrovi TaxID=2016596 RepID=A0A6C1B1U0_9RHOO|nr:LysM peptidoglycan-binding domain-containing protein [Nitrogeniibacter mangrovi]QID16310.1 LysM peptidoglycan-binding domain-containing protein [Nitrogeniibacter mangrovi]
MIRIIFSLFIGVAAVVQSVSAAEPVQLAANAPDSYVVKKGDTLWDISGKFLSQPWRWPEVWQMNRDQIRNPHLIYPGQIIVLDRSGPYLRLGRRVGRDIKPTIYTSPADQAIPSIPQNEIAPFLTQPLVVDEKNIAHSATIVATQENRLFTGQGDTVFAKDVDPSIDQWYIYRPARPLEDPVTKEVLGYEAVHLGSANVTQHGNPAVLEITLAKQEIGTGERMLPADRPDLLSYVPHAPESKVEGRVIGIYGGVSETGRQGVITLGVGQRDGIEVGHVLALYRYRGEVEYKDEETGDKETFNLPEHRYGLVFVFRVFDRVSYGLVVDATAPVKVADTVRTP